MAKRNEVIFEFMFRENSLIFQTINADGLELCLRHYKDGHSARGRSSPTTDYENV